VNVVAIQPVVVDAQGVFEVLYSVVPSAWNKYGLPSFLEALQCRQTHLSGPCSVLQKRKRKKRLRLLASIQ